MPKKTKHPVVRKEWPRIIDYRANNIRRLMLDARPHGKREYFKTIGEAKARADQLAAERDNRGIEALSFSTENRVMAVECLEMLRPFGKTLKDATTHYVTWLRAEAARHSSLLVRECIEQFLKARQADVDRGDLSKLSFYEVRARAKRLSEAFGGMHVADVTEDTIKTYLDSIPFSARTRENVRLRMSKFFNFCKSKGWIVSNPCETIKIRVQRADTRILSVAEAKELLTKARECEFKDHALPYTAICLFAGLRPGEAEQLHWEQVHFKTRTIEVLGHTSKGRESRFVHIEKNLLAWLKPYVKSKGRIVGNNFRKEWDAVKRVAGYDPQEKQSRWVQDIMRHSYASYWLGLHQNRAALAEQMGNSVDVIRSHYRRPILPSEARKYWALGLPRK
jgi:integrase/recombinase XerD